MAQSSAFATAVNIIVSPNEAFAAIKARSRAWLPLLLLIIGYCAVSMTYLNSVDMGWFMDRQLQAAGVDFTDEQREQAGARAARLSPVGLAAIGTVGFAVVLLLWLFLFSVYLTGVSFATNDGVKLKQWFALSSWCALPLLIQFVAILANVYFRDARFLAQEDLNPISFHSLLAFDTSNANLFQRALFNIDPTSLWSLILTVFGYQAWTQRSLAKSASIVLAPLVVIVAAGVAITLL